MDPHGLVSGDEHAETVATLGSVTVDRASRIAFLPPVLGSLLLMAVAPAGCELGESPQGEEISTPMGPDQTAELQARLDSTPAGGILELKPGAEYVVNGILWIDRRSDVTIKGNGAPFHVTEHCGLGCGPGGRGWRWTVWIRDGSNIEVRNLNIVGPTGGAVLDTAYEGEHGFASRAGGT